MTKNFFPRYFKKHKFDNIKGTLMQFWKSLHSLCSYKYHILKISHSESLEFSSYSLVKFLFFSKSISLFLYICQQKFRISKVRISQKTKGVITRNLRDTIFSMKTNVLQDFHICISVPLRMSIFKILIDRRLYK